MSDLMKKMFLAEPNVPLYLHERGRNHELEQALWGDFMPERWARGYDTKDAKGKTERAKIIIKGLAEDLEKAETKLKDLYLLSLCTTQDANKILKTE